MKSFGLTDRGLVREINEDELFKSDTAIGCLPNLYIVADGMGGHNAGDVASRNCTRYIVEYIESAEIDKDVETLLKDAVDYANGKVYLEGVEDNNLSTNTPTNEAWNKNSAIKKDIFYYKYKRQLPHHGTGSWVLF